MTIVSRLFSTAPRRERPAKETLEPRGLYRTHLGFVWRNLRRLGVPEFSAEDAAQDVFIVVHRRWDSYDARWSSVETWLFGIVLRVARNYRRAAQRRQGRFDANTDADEVLQRVATPRSTPDEIAESREAAALLDRLLTQLSDKKRAMLVMVDIEEMSVPEAAQALDVNVNTAYWRLRAARQEFQKALACQKDAPLVSTATSGASGRVTQ